MTSETAVLETPQAAAPIPAAPAPTESTPAPPAPERNPLLVEIGFDFDAAPDADSGQDEGGSTGDSAGGADEELIPKSKAEALAEARAAEARKAGADEKEAALSAQQAAEKADNDRRTREAGQKQAATSLRNLILASFGTVDDAGSFVFHNDELRGHYSRIEGAIANIEGAVLLAARDRTTASLLAALPKEEQSDFQKDVDKAIRDAAANPDARPMDVITAAWKKRIVTSETKGLYTKAQLKEAVDAALTADQERRARAGEARGAQAPARINNGAGGRGQSYKTKDEINVAHINGVITTAQKQELKAQPWYAGLPDF